MTTKQQAIELSKRAEALATLAINQRDMIKRLRVQIERLRHEVERLHECLAADDIEE